MAEITTLDPAQTSSLLLAAFEAHRAGRTDEAERGYRRVIALDPINADALHLLGVLARLRGAAAEAVELIEAALRLAPQLTDARANLGNALVDCGRFDEAVIAYEAVLRVRPDDSAIRQRLSTSLVRAATAHASAGRTDPARRLLNRALELQPDRLDLIAALLPLSVDTEMDQTLTLAVSAWRLAPTDAHWDQLWDVANRAGRDIGAASAWVGRAPDDPFALIALGNAQRWHGRGWAAEASYRAAIAAAPDAPFAYGRLANLLFDQGRLKEADRLYRRVDALHPARTGVLVTDPGFFAALATRPLPPAPTMLRPLSVHGRVVVFAACDPVYFERFASALLNSTVRNSGLDCTFHLHVVDPPPGLLDRIEALDRRLGSPGIGLSVEQTGAEAWERQARNTWYACARFRVLPHLMRLSGRPILMLDTDLIVLADLKPLLAAASAGDVAVVTVDANRNEPWNWMWADVVFANTTTAARSYFDQVARYVDHFLGQGKKSWFLDQIALAACYRAGQRGEPRPELIGLPRDIHRLHLEVAGGVDVPPEPTTLFWSAHASNVDTALTLATPRYQDYVLPLD